MKSSQQLSASQTERSGTLPTSEETHFIVYHHRGIDFLPPYQIAIQLAKRNLTTLVDAPTHWRRLSKIPCRHRVKTLDGLRVLSPYELPRRWHLAFLTDRLNAAWSRHDVRSLCKGDEIRFVLYDRPQQFRVCGKLSEAVAGYYAYDDFTVNIVGQEHRTVAYLESQMLERADVVFAVSQLLAEKMSKKHRCVHYVPNGFNGDLFYPRAVHDGGPLLSAIRPPIIGFAGYISGRIDIIGLLRTAVARRDWSFVFLGAVSRQIREELASTGRDSDSFDALLALPNVHHLGSVPIDHVPPMMGCFDVGLIPYCLNRFTMASSPLKAYEYYAMGVPFITTGVPEVVAFAPGAPVVDQGETYVPAIELALSTAHVREHVVQRIAIAAPHSTATRAHQIETTMLELAGLERSSCK